MLNTQIVLQLRNRMTGVAALKSNAIITPEAEQAIALGEREINGFFSDPAVRDELLGNYLATQNEYVPLIHALAPLVNRVNQTIHGIASQQSAARQSKEVESKVVAMVADSKS